MTNGTDKSIGKLEGKMDLVLAALNRLADKVDNLETKGCVQGKSNLDRLDKLEVRTGKIEMTVAKAIMIGLLTAGGSLSLVEVVKLLIP